MRNLREKLMAVAAKPAERTVQPVKRPEPVFCREHLVPFHDLCGFEYTTIDDIRAIDPLFTGESWDVRRVIFLDTETTGLSGGSGTVAFEVGVGFLDARGLIIRQYVMRDYNEEPAMLAELASLLSRFDTIVTFNGKSFDLPLLESRMIMSRIRLPLREMPHLDLLHAYRRVYKLRLKRCTLSALEEAILDRQRNDDLPGSQVPQRYFDYIKTREFALIEDVLRHNFEDVRSLAVLTGHLCAAFREPESMLYPQDLLGVGKTLQRAGYIGRARHCFRILGHTTLAPAAHMYLASSYKKERDWKQAVAVWRSMVACGAGGTMPYTELAKYYEHVEKDVLKALSYSRSALDYALNFSMIGDLDEREIEGIRRRIDRLVRKKNRNMDTQHKEE